MSAPMPQAICPGQFQTAVLSAAGGRENNQDACQWLQVDRNFCWVVADGLGGHKAGEVASTAAALAALASFRLNPECSRAALAAHISSAQDTLHRLQEENTAYTGMRTTLVLLLTNSEQVLWAHIGDSRLYRFQSGHLVARTQDHSVVQTLVNSGEIRQDAVRGHKDRNRLLQSLGDAALPQPAVSDHVPPLCPQEAFLLCTDGFWEHVLENEMIVDLAASSSPEQWLKRAESRLLMRASGRFDNYSAVGILFQSERAGGPS